MRALLLLLVLAGCAAPDPTAPIHLAAGSDPAARPGASSIGAWRVGCRTDSVRAETLCAATRVDRLSAGMEERVSVAYIRRAGGGVSGPFIYPAGVHDCYGAARVFRVDDRAPVAARFPADGWSQAAMATVARQMEGGRFLRSESRRWPTCEVPRQAMVEITGFEAAHAELRRMTQEAAPR